MVDTEMLTLDIYYAHITKHEKNASTNSIFAACTKLSIWEICLCVSVCLMAIYSIRFSTFHSPCKLLAIDTFFPRSTEMLCLFHIHIEFSSETSELSWQYCSWELKIKLHISVRLLLPAAHSAMHTNTQAHTHAEHVFFEFHLLLNVHSSDDFCSFHVCDNLSFSHIHYTHTHTSTEYVFILQPQIDILFHFIAFLILLP